jgi:transcriptional regulator with XRE-family HTH domain
MKLSMKVKYARRLRDLSQQQLARRADVSMATVVRVEGEKGPVPRPKTIQALAKALDVDLNWLTDERQEIRDLHAGPIVGVESGSSEGQGVSGLATGERTAAVRELLRQAIRAIEEGPAVPRVGETAVEPAGNQKQAQPTSRPWGVAPARMAPVFDIGADHDRDWHDGDFPTGHGYDERPAFNADPSGFWCVLHGDSMAPELVEGDLLYFSPTLTSPKDGDVCLVRTSDFATVKRVFLNQPGKARLAATNPRYPDRTVDLAREVTQLHKVLCFVRMLP